MYHFKLSIVIFVSNNYLNYKMKIAFLTPEYPHQKIVHTAGIGTSIKNLSAALTQKGQQVVVFVYGQHENLVLKKLKNKYNQ